MGEGRGCSMSSAFAPLITNIFMSYHEIKWSNEYNHNKRKFYLKCFDDIVATVHRDEDSLNY